MPTPYNTGKVMIGGAYLPRRNARYADPFEAYESSRAFRFWRAVLCLAMFALMGVMLAACGQREVVGSAQPSTVVTSYGPDEHGVVCYQIYLRTAPLSCVKVR
jgi:hypothetical protein